VFAIVKPSPRRRSSEGLLLLSTEHGGEGIVSIGFEAAEVFLEVEFAAIRPHGDVEGDKYHHHKPHHDVIQSLSRLGRRRRRGLLVVTIQV